MDSNLPALGDLERAVMQLVWARVPLTADAVRKLLARRLRDSAVRTVFRRLEKKRRA
jgi:BlaI family penicillinase repressor